MSTQLSVSLEALRLHFTRRRAILLLPGLLCLMWFFHGRPLLAQKATTAGVRAKVVSSRLFPRLAAPAGKTARILVIDYPTETRFGDRIEIRAQLTNVSAESVYVPRFDLVSELRVYDSNGKKISILPNGIPEFRSIPLLYQKVEPGKSKDVILRYVVGCRNRDEEPDSLWGRGCLDISGTGTFYIAVHLTNEGVVQERPFVANTLVGVLESERVSLKVQ